MKIAKKICSLMIIVLFISLALAPAVNAREDFDDIFEIEYEDENGDLYSVKVETGQDQFQNFEEIILV